MSYSNLATGRGQRPAIFSQDQARVCFGPGDGLGGHRPAEALGGEVDGVFDDTLRLPRCGGQAMTLTPQCSATRSYS